MHTSIFLRIAAGFVDATLAVAVAFGAFVVAQTRAGVPLVLDLRVLWVALGVFALRDVAGGASVAKWLMGLRVESAAGRPAPFLSRLARVPWALLPLGLIPAVERRTPWRVNPYVPTAAGLAARAFLATAGLGATLIWGGSALRPSIGRSDAMHLVQSTLLSDPFLRSQLGDPLTAEVGEVTRRSRASLTSREGAFQLRIRGSRAAQSMTVRARKVDGAWTVDEVTDIDISALESGGRDPVVAQ